MTPHTHTAIVQGCYRCDLGRDEERASLIDQLEETLTLARVLRDHVPELAIDKRTTPLGCAVCAVSSFVRWPCPDRKRASEALDE